MGLYQSALAVEIGPQCDSNLARIVDEAGKMWPYNMVPKEKIKKEFGFSLSKNFLKRTRLASTRFSSGGSGSFISRSLVSTNHHVARSALNAISKPGQDYVRDGFYANSLDKEIPIPNLYIDVLKIIRDVTAEVIAATKNIPETDYANISKVRREVIAKIEKEAIENKGSDTKVEVVSLYEGGRYNLYIYKRYTDLRLVFAPEADIASFGGDVANFEFPRTNLDVTFFRAYENGKPVNVDNYFPVSRKGAKDGELLFISGHPGHTNRIFTKSDLEHMRNVLLPWNLEFFYRRLDVLRKYASLGSEQKRQIDKEFQSLMNYRKVYEGEIAAFDHDKIIEKREVTEKAFRARVMSDPKLQQYADAWNIIEQVNRVDTMSRMPRIFLDDGMGFNTSLFSQARVLVRLPVETAKPNGDRYGAYQDANLETLKKSILEKVPVYRELEVAKLSDSLQFMVEKLGADNHWVQISLAGKSPSDRAKELIENSKLFDPDFSKALIDGGQKAIDASTDPMILLLKSLDAETRRLRSENEDKIQTPSMVAYQKLANAQFAIFGTEITPDATFTLRLTYGVVKGYDEVNGQKVMPFTTVANAFIDEAHFKGEEPWRLPESWHVANAKLNQKVEFNFISTHDTIGGNSGSPVINKQREIVGLLFDGNKHGFGKRFAYDDTDRSRSVSVDIRVVMESLRNVYNATALVNELENPSISRR